MKSKSGRLGFTLVELLVLVIVLGVSAALLVPAVVRARRNMKVARCANNLSQLWRLQTLYAQRFGGADKLLPHETGGAFWLRLTQTSPPLLEAHEGAPILDCPLERGAPAAGRTSYRGPSMDVNNLVEPYTAGHPIGACPEGVHGAGEGGCVLRRSGEVTVVGGQDNLWKAAATRTKP